MARLLEPLHFTLCQSFSTEQDLLAKEDGEAAKRFGAIDAKRKSDQAYEEDLLNSFGPGALDVFTKRELDQLQYGGCLRSRIL